MNGKIRSSFFLPASRLSLKCHQPLPILGALFLICISCTAFAADSGILSLSEAEMMALSNDPTTKEARAQQESFKEKSVAANTWPDPKLNMGIVNISANTMDFQ